MGYKHKRTKEMMDRYVYLFDNGFDPIEIAHIYDVSPSTVYRTLGEIGIEVNRRRPALLRYPEKGNPYGCRGKTSKLGHQNHRAQPRQTIIITSPLSATK